MNPYNEVSFRDELLADGSVHRTFSNGREEWRRREGRVVAWRDNQGRSGTDELLGDKIIKRLYATGQAVYAREQGYGRTLWGDGQLTVNQTSFGGRMGVILAAVGAGVVLGALVAPPLMMSPEEEETLRQQAQQSSSDSDSGDGGDGGDGGSGGSGDSGGSHSDWHDGDGGMDDDFG